MNQISSGQGEAFTVKDVRSALKLWHDATQLGTHRLAHLRLVEVKRVTDNYLLVHIGSGN